MRMTKTVFKKYLSYVLRHKWFVFVECCKMGIPLRGLLHDISKFRSEEFSSYANYFYGDKIPDDKYIAGQESSINIKHAIDSHRESVVEGRMNYSWLGHQHKNKHHWQYWILRHDSGGTTLMEIPYKYVKEMVADWLGAGRAINGKDDDTKSWYESNKDKMQMHENTRKIVEELLNEYS